jgi:hypothetical protein
MVLGHEQLPMPVRQANQHPANQWSGPQVELGLYGCVEESRPLPREILGAPQIMLRDVDVDMLHDFLAGDRGAAIAYPKPHRVMSSDGVSDTPQEHRRIDLAVEMDHRGSVIRAIVGDQLLLQPHDLLLGAEREHRISF